GWRGGGGGGVKGGGGGWVFGIEGDGPATNKAGQAFPAATVLPLVGGGNSIVNQNEQFEMQERWLVTARGKLGLTNFWWFGDKTLVYVTGGAAWAKIDSSLAVIGSPINSGVFQSDRRTGWTIGGGPRGRAGHGG